MAKPTGAIEVSNLGYWMDSRLDDEFVYIGHRLAQAIRYWRLLMWPYMRIKYKSCVTIPAGSTLDIYYGSKKETRTGACASEWSANWIETESPVTSSGTMPPESSPHDCIPEEDILATVKQIRFVIEDKADEATIHAIAVCLWYDIDYDGAPHPPTDHVERIDRSDGADCVYRVYSSLSAWHGMQVIAANLNRTAYQARLTFCIPLFKEAWAT